MLRLTSNKYIFEKTKFRTKQVSKQNNYKKKNKLKMTIIKYFKKDKTVSVVEESPRSPLKVSNPTIVEKRR